MTSKLVKSVMQTRGVSRERAIYFLKRELFLMHEKFIHQKREKRGAMK